MDILTYFMKTLKLKIHICFVKVYMTFIKVELTKKPHRLKNSMRLAKYITKIN